MKPLEPWYRGFKGTSEKNDKGSYRVTGTIRKLSSTSVEITELPLKSWTQSYKEQLEEWLVGTPKQEAWITDYKEYHTDTRVHFVVGMTQENLEKAEAEGLEKRFKLSTSISTTNLVCFDLEGRIKKYDNVDSILREFFDIRLRYYQKRKDHMLERLSREWTKLENKVRFITEIINGSLVVSNRKKADLLSILKKSNYAQFFKNGSKVEGKLDIELDEDDNDALGGESGYDYLLSMAIWSLTMEKVY